MRITLEISWSRFVKIIVFLILQKLCTLSRIYPPLMVGYIHHLSRLGRTEETPSSNLVPISMSSSKGMTDAIQLMPLVTPVYQPLHDHCFLSRCYYLFSSSDFTSLPLGGNIRDHNNLSPKTKKLGGLVSMRKHIFGYQYLKQIISIISNDKPGVFCICTLLGSIPRKKSFIHRQKVTPWKLRLLILVASTFR